ncbi:thiamine-phosphate kinase [Pseudarthrobacter sp. J1738]|uniref:thiamine-phosphate kinase n=1 Tax=Pseudarthrobacter sp. J1738 TaxID=3420446 RepID=UPI003D2897ED
MATQELLVSDLSEGQLLERIFPRLHNRAIDSTAAPLLGPGDDAAIISAPDGRLVISVDTQTQDQDFRLLWPNGYQTTGYDVGWKAAAQNLSDINAMGAVPTALVVSLTLPPHTPVVWVEALAEGLSDALFTLGATRCSVVGGDLGAGTELSITAAVTGDLAGATPVLRSGAKAGDVLAVAGRLGHAAAGLALLESAPPLTTAADHAQEQRRSQAASEFQNLIRLQCRPEPPLAAGPMAAASGATAMMDISDSLLRDGGRLAKASGVAVHLDAAALNSRRAPLEAAGQLLGVDPMEWILRGGEDHGLLATFGPEVPLPEGFAAIGSIVAVAPGDTARVVLPGTANGSPGISSAGWDHFAE